MQLKVILSILIFYAPGILSPVYSQLDIWDGLNQLHLEFTEEDNRELKRVEQQREIAYRLIARAVESESLPDLEIAFDELFTAGLTFFEIYDKNSRTERGKHPEEIMDELDRPVKLERMARDYIDKSKVLIDEAENYDEISRSEQLYWMAFDLKQLALLHKGRALRLYQDLPFVYFYQWEDDVTLMTGTPERIIRVINYDTEETAIPGQKDDRLSGQIREPVAQPAGQTREPGAQPAGQTREPVAQPAGQTREPVAQPAGQTRGSDRQNQQSPGRLPETNELYYIVQIAAHDREIPDSDLNKIYSGQRTINMIREDGWYKYFLGPCSSFEEADRIMKSLSTRNVFIAAYFEGKRIPVGEARKKEKR